MAAALPITLRALADAAISDTGVAVDCTRLTATTDASSTVRVPRWAAKLTLDIISLSAGAMLEVHIETSETGAGDWRHLRTEEHVAPLDEPLELYVGGLQRYVRARWVLTGGTARFGLVGEAHTVYCKPRQLASDAVPEASIAHCNETSRIRVCVVGSTEAEGYLASSYTTPILSWDTDLEEKTALISAAKLFSVRGRVPESPDAGVFKAADDARDKWFDRIANGKLKPPGIVDTTPEVFEGGSVVASAPSRGWR